MPDSLLSQVVVSLIVFGAFPALIVWQLWDSLSPRHAVVPLVAAVVLGIAAAAAYAWLRGSPSGMARLVPALLLFGAGALGAFLLVVATMVGVSLAVRDERSVEAARQRRRASGEPIRPSMAPLSMKEVYFRLVFSLVLMALFWIGAVVHMVTSESMPNYLRAVGLFAGPNDPRVLSHASTPDAYFLQLSIFAALALAFSAWAVVAYLRRKR